MSSSVTPPHTGALAAVVTPAACDACLRRSWLLSVLAANLEIAWQRKRRLVDVLSLSDVELIEGLGGGARPRLLEQHAAWDAAELRAAAARAGTEAICCHDPGFPAALCDGAPGAPLVLHAYATTAHAPASRTDATAGPAPRAAAPDPLARLGAACGAPSVAIVGTRAASPDALEMARGLGRGLARAGVTVVSGMALGIDSAAHAGALEAGGRTVAVLAGAAEIAYPRSKAGVHRQIAASSCVVSELPPGFTPRRWCFPARNRIIAGLASVTVVVEGAERSGSLITADFATQLGRDVAAVPGPAMSAKARGSNGLIRDGAAVVLGVQDLLDLVLGLDLHAEARAAAQPGFGPPGDATPLRLALEPGLERLLTAIGDGRGSVAALARTPEQADAVLVGLADLEARGLVRRGTDGRWVRVVDV